jgi:ABC-2 type transport system ATP-binding protein
MFAIETSNLCKSFMEEASLKDLLIHPFRKRAIVTAVADVSLKVRKGEIFGLVGPNGAGKTTLIKLLCSLIIPTSGSARVNGYDLLSDDEGIRRSIGLVTSDERSFFWRLSGRKNLEFFGGLYDLPPRTIRKRVRELIALVGLEDKADSIFKTYSAGTKKKMAIVRGLLNDPDIIFMDESTNSLDPPAAQMLKEFVKEKLVGERGKTVFWATHRLEEIEGLCDRVALINDARVGFVGGVDEFKNILRGESKYLIRVSNLSGSVEEILRRFESARSEIANVSADELIIRIHAIDDNRIMSEILRELLKSGGTIVEYRLEEPSIQDAFSRHIKGS